VVKKYIENIIPKKMSQLDPEIIEAFRKYWQINPFILYLAYKVDMKRVDFSNISICI
jgi:hypothetical protein